jgi:hypothetical protein
MGEEHTSLAHPQTRRRKHGEQLHQEQARLAGLIDENQKKEFFNQILPLLKPLKSYINRRRRVA